MILIGTHFLNLLLKIQIILYVFSTYTNLSIFGFSNSSSSFAGRIDTIAAQAAGTGSLDSSSLAASITEVRGALTTFSSSAAVQLVSLSASFSNTSYRVYLSQSS